MVWYKCNVSICVNGTTSVPKSVLRYSMDMVRQESKSEVWNSTARFVQKLKSPIKVFQMSYYAYKNEFQQILTHIHIIMRTF